MIFSYARRSLPSVIAPIDNGLGWVQQLISNRLLNPEQLKSFRAFISPYGGCQALQQNQFTGRYWKQFRRSFLSSRRFSGSGSEMNVGGERECFRIQDYPRGNSTQHQSASQPASQPARQPTRSGWFRKGRRHILHDSMRVMIEYRDRVK